jgi:PAS domain S-box-containing protein
MIQDKQACEVALRKEGDSQHFAQIDAVISDSGQECRIVLIDITERKRADEAQAQLATLVDSSDDAIIAKNLDGIILSWNKGAERLFGYRADEIIGKSVNLLLPPELQEEGERILRRLSTGERIEHFETVRLTKDGRQIEVSVTVSPIIDSLGRIIGASKIARDITERKRLEAYREMGREVLQILNEPGDIKDTIQRILAEFKIRAEFDAVGIRLQEGDDFPYYVLGGFSKDFLQMENTLIRRSTPDGVCRDEDGNISLECTCGLVISGKTDPANPLFTPWGSFWTNDSLPLLNIPPDEEPRLHPRNLCIDQGYASVALVPIRDADRNVGLIQLKARRKGCFSTDTVEILEGIAAHIGSALLRKQVEEALAEKRKKLEELNEILEDRVNQAVNEVRQKDQMLILQGRQAAMGEMINNIAHQWRQPLNTLGLLIQGLPLFYDSDEFSKEYLKKNTDQCMELIQHMSRTIDDFKNFFKPDKKAVTFNVNQVIENTISLIEESFKAEKIGIDYHKQGDLNLTGFPNEYSQVLLNILMNARDVLTENKVVDALISIRMFTEGGKSVITITDNGGGIPDKIIDKLFEPYFTTKGPDKGTGIGLFMSKTIIEKNMGGMLTVLNTGKGAEFRIEV